MLFLSSRSQNGPCKQTERTDKKKKRKYVGINFPTRCTSLHPSLSFSLSAQTVSFCTLQGKYWMPWTDLSFLKDCWHLSSTHLKLLRTHFSRAHMQRGRDIQKVLSTLTPWLTSLSLFHAHNLSSSQIRCSVNIRNSCIRLLGDKS